MPTYTRPIEARLLQSGLVSGTTLFVRVENASGGTLVAPITSGVVEDGASAHYRLPGGLQFDAAWSGAVVWYGAGNVTLARDPFAAYFPQSGDVNEGLDGGIPSVGEIVDGLEAEGRVLSLVKIDTTKAAMLADRVMSLQLTGAIVSSGGPTSVIVALDDDINVSANALVNQWLRITDGSLVGSMGLIKANTAGNTVSFTLYTDDGLSLGSSTPSVDDSVTIIGNFQPGPGTN